MININKYIIEKLKLSKDSKDEFNIELLYTARYICWLFDLITDDFNEDSIKRFKEECTEGSGLISAIYKWVCENDVDRNADYFTPICNNLDRIRVSVIKQKFTEDRDGINQAILDIGKSETLLGESGTIKLFGNSHKLLAYDNDVPDHRMIYLDR